MLKINPKIFQIEELNQNDFWLIAKVALIMKTYKKNKFRTQTLQKYTGFGRSKIIGITDKLHNLKILQKTRTTKKYGGFGTNEYRILTNFISWESVENFEDQVFEIEDDFEPNNNQKTDLNLNQNQHNLTSSGNQTTAFEAKKRVEQENQLLCVDKISPNEESIDVLKSDDALSENRITNKTILIPYSLNYSYSTKEKNLESEDFEFKKLNFEIKKQKVLEEIKDPKNPFLFALKKFSLTDQELDFTIEEVLIKNLDATFELAVSKVLSFAPYSKINFAKIKLAQKEQQEREQNAQKIKELTEKRINEYHDKKMQNIQKIGENEKFKKEKNFWASNKNHEETYLENLGLDSEIKSNLKSWLEIRKAKKTPTTQTAIDLNIKKLIQFSKQTQIEMIQNSIMNGWTGIFEIKKNNFSPPKKLRDPILDQYANIKTTYI
jgi:hypothetical protein